jgi:aromatic-L-amino-acid/L-tryptophan decarboxylase
MSIDGIERGEVVWPDWAITTRIETWDYWRTVWQAVCCHRTQLPMSQVLELVSEEQHRILWNSQTYNRAFSLVNGSRGVEVPADLGEIGEADSVAVDPHKWMYAPLEAGCILVRNQEALRETFSYHPPYFYFAEEPSTIDYYEYGPQNSRGFRALKVWLALRQVGREGYVEMIADDIVLAQELYRLIEEHHELQAFTQGLSITTFRYIPADLTSGSERVEAYLNKLNAEVLSRLQRSGEVFLSNAVVRGTFLLRACVVNFRTSLEDIEALPGIVMRIGKEVDAAMRLGNLNI